jgi:hypothetical protein
MPFLTRRTNELRQQGPLIQVTFTVPPAIGFELQKANKLIPSIPVVGLIDTGASCTCINKKIVDALGLLPFDVQTVFTANGPTEQLLYDIGIGLPISAPMFIPLQSPCADLDGQPFDALIGRDVLSMCTLFYNGSDNSFSLHF